MAEQKKAEVSTYKKGSGERQATIKYATVPTRVNFFRGITQNDDGKLWRDGEGIKIAKIGQDSPSIWSHFQLPASATQHTLSL